MAAQGRTGSGIDMPIKVLILGHSFIVGFKKFLKEDPSKHNLKLNLSAKELMIQFSGHRGASISQIRANLFSTTGMHPAGWL